MNSPSDMQKLFEIEHAMFDPPHIIIRDVGNNNRNIVGGMDSSQESQDRVELATITHTPSNCLCLDEFSRDYSSFTIQVVSSSETDVSYYPATVPSRSLLSIHKYPELNKSLNPNAVVLKEAEKDIDKDGDKESSMSSILRFYDPSFAGVPSALRKVPEMKLRRLLHPSQSPLDYTLHINFSVSQHQVSDLTEPVFANLALYSFNSGSGSNGSTSTISRISESLHIDLSPDHIRARFAYVYEGIDGSKDAPLSDRAVPVKSEKSRTATGRDAITTTISEHCVVNLPSNIAKSELYLVVQLTKVLTPESEKTGSRLRSTREERVVTDPDEAYRRLRNFRQIVGLGVMKVYTSAEGVVAGDGDALRCIISPVKSSVSASVIAQYIKDNLPDNSIAVTKGDSVMGLDIMLSLSEQLPDMDSLYRSSGSGRAVTELAFFPPSTYGIYRRLRATIDNDLFVYPLSLENCEQRNLCVKVQLVEASSSAASSSVETVQMTVLKHVYSSVFGSHNSLTSSALSTTSYHNKSPTFAEEFRLLLPDVVSDRHFLQFTVQHIHVKAKPAGGAKGVFGGVFGSAEPTSSDVYSVVGVGLLPLLQKEGHFLLDAEYEVPITLSSDSTATGSAVARTYRSDTVDALRGLVGSSTSSSVPILRVSTRCMSALQSTCPWVQALRQHCVPSPLGLLPGSRGWSQLYPDAQALAVPNINLLTNAVKGLRVASTQQIIDHFRVIVRILSRVLCGGTGTFSEGFSDPFAHSTLRCQAFLDLLHVFGCLAPEASELPSSPQTTSSPDYSETYSDSPPESLLLQAFVEFVFSEELPVSEHASTSFSQVDSRASGNTSSQSFANPGSVAVDGNSRYKYLSFVSEHFATEVERVLVDELIDEAVNELVQEHLAASVVSMPASTKEARDSRRVGTSSRTRSNSLLSLGRAKQSMSSLNSKIKGPLKSAKVNSRPNSVGFDQHQSLPPFQHYHMSVRGPDSSVSAPGSRSRSPEPLVKQTDLQSLRVRVRLPRPCYASLEGHAARNSASLGESGAKWWPWMYEVLAHQWLCLLLTCSGESPVPIPGHTPTTADSASYPINPQAIPKSDVPSKDIKRLAIDHVSTLLTMILKSLMLRISHEKKETPLMLNSASLFVFEQLFGALAKETKHRSMSLARSRALTRAVAAFFRSLFSILIPAQVALLIASYYSNLSASYRKEDCIELRLLLCEELSTIDSFFSVNNSTVSDAISGLNEPEESDSRRQPSICSTRFHSLCLRSDTAIDPPTNWLSELLMHASFSAYRHVDRTMHMQEKALQLIRSVLVRQSCDQRYQGINISQQISCLYLPLLVEVLKETYLLASKSYDSVERREMLPLLLHLLENLPPHVLRSELRLFCLELYRFIPQGSTHDGNGYSRPTSMTLQPVVSPRFACASAEDMSASILPSDNHSSPQSNVVGVDVNAAQPMIVLLLVLLNSVIDSFEYQSYTPLVVAIKRDDGTKMRSQSTASVTGKGAGFDFSTRLNRLEALLNKRDRKSTGSASTRSAVSTTAIADPFSDDQASYGGKDAVPSSSLPEERKWFKHKESLGTKLSELTGRHNEVDRSLYNSSLILLSHTSSTIVAQTVSLILDECQYAPLPSTARVADRSVIMPLLRDTPRATTLKIVQYSLFTALHGLYCHQTVGAIVSFLCIPRQILRVYGVEIFLTSVGDTLQDWVRALFRCLSYNQSDVTAATCEVIVLLMSSCSRAFGSTTRVADVLKAVLFDSIETVIDVYHDTTESVAEEDKLLDPILQAILSLQRDSKLVVKFIGDFDSVTNQGNGSSLLASQEAKEIQKVMKDLEIVFRATTQLRHHLMTPVPCMWDGGSGLDSSLKRGSQRRSRLRKSSVASLLATAVPNSHSSSAADMDAVAESFFAAAGVFDPVRLPRLRIFWLEQLVRLHESLRTRGDQAEARWRIYETMLIAESHWEAAWSPRKPLSWQRGSRSAESVSPENSPGRRTPPPPRTPSPNSSPNKRLSTASPASPVSIASAASDRLAYAPSQHRNFLGLLYQVVNTAPMKPWNDRSQFYLHMEQTLTACKVHLCNIGLSYLAERATLALVDLHRRTMQVRKIAEEYATLAAAFQSTSDSGNSSFGMGTFYWVQFVGQGTPPALRDEFVYRNSLNLHVSEVHSELKHLLEASVSPGVEVKIASQLVPSEADIESPHAIIFITSVKPVLAPATADCRYSANQAREFQLSVPFTKTGVKPHAKSMTDQWKRTLTFFVSEPFPYICGRQRVCRKSSRELTPIEAAIDDIEDRISAFKQELSGAVVLNNIMRLVQGSVMPQVNAGAGEVAKVFLGKSNSDSCSALSDLDKDDEDNVSSSQSQLAIRLKETLLEFLLWSRVLLRKCRETMKLDPVSGEGSADGAANNTGGSMTGSITATVVRQMSQTQPTSVPSATDVQNGIWLTEMERGFDVLVDTIYPYISDVKGAVALKK